MIQISYFTITEQLKSILISYTMILAIRRKTAIFTAMQYILQQLLFY